MKKQDFYGEYIQSICQIFKKETGIAPYYGQYQIFETYSAFHQAVTGSCSQGDMLQFADHVLVAIESNEYENTFYLFYNANSGGKFIIERSGSESYLQTFLIQATAESVALAPYHFDPEEVIKIGMDSIRIHMPNTPKGKLIQEGFAHASYGAMLSR